MSQVSVDDQYPLALQCDSGCRVHCQERLAAARVERSEQRNACLAVGLDIEHELQVGTQHAERFVDYISVALCDDNRLGGLAFFLSACRQRDFPSEWQRERLQVLAPAYLGVHILTDKYDDHWDKQAEGYRNQGNVLLDRSGGYHAARRRGDDAGVVGSERLGKFVFLTLLQQEQVKCFFHFLLAFHREKVFSLCRIGGNPCGGLLLALLKRAQLGIECGDMVVY